MLLIMVKLSTMRFEQYCIGQFTNLTNFNFSSMSFFEYLLIVTAISLAPNYLFDFPMFNFNLIMQLIKLINISTNYAFISKVTHHSTICLLKNNFVNFNLSKFHKANKISNNYILENEQYHLMFQHFENKQCLISF